MGLRNLSHPQRRIELPGGDSFTVRGISPDMVVSLYNRHAGQFSQLFDSAVGAAKGSATAGGDLWTTVGSLLGDAPDIGAELIAIASGSRVTDTNVDPDTEVNPAGLTDWERDIASARALAFPVQVDALMQIADITFSSGMPPGKFLAVVIDLAGKATAALNKPAD